MSIDWNSNCAAVIPCFNEAAYVSTVVGQVRQHLANIIVVDDGSTDATSDRSSTAGAEVIRHSRKLGKGSALRRGWQHAYERGFAWVLMMDGDGQHAAEDIPTFFNCAEKTQAKLIIGNRMSNPQGMPWLRRSVNRWMSRRISSLTGAQLPDSQCGFRLAHLETLLSLRLTAPRFEMESAMLVAFLRDGQRVEFVPVQTIYNRSVSKICPLADTYRWLRWQRLVARSRRHESSHGDTRRRHCACSSLG
jgi:glycosyltransferase involved in cell wall biosynthesis